MSLRWKKYLRLLWYTLAEHEQWPIHEHYLYLSYCSLASPTIYYSSLPNILHVCLLSFWLFFSWRITFQFSLLSILPVHVIITLCFFFFLLTNVLTFQFLSYQYYFTRTKNYYLILHVHFFSWWQSGHIPVSILLILHAFFYSYLFLAFLFLLTYVVTIQLLPALDLFTQEVLFLAATFTTDWHLFLTYPNVGTFPRMAHSTTWMATRHLQS